MLHSCAKCRENKTGHQYYKERVNARKLWENKTGYTHKHVQTSCVGKKFDRVLRDGIRHHSWTDDRNTISLRNTINVINSYPKSQAKKQNLKISIIITEFQGVLNLIILFLLTTRTFVMSVPLANPFAVRFIDSLVKCQIQTGKHRA
jgi:hypothetical protein